MLVIFDSDKVIVSKEENKNFKVHLFSVFMSNSSMKKHISMCCKEPCVLQTFSYPLNFFMF